MTTKKYYFDKGIKLCLTCKFIDEYAWNAKDDGKVPYGYDGTAECGLFNWDADYLDIFDTETQSIIPNPNDISKINNESM
jgi:hypothetical protein